MYLRALIKTLKEENDVLKQEKVEAVQKLEDANCKMNEMQCKITKLEMEIFEMTQANTNAIDKHKLEISKLNLQLGEARQEIESHHETKNEIRKDADLKSEKLKQDAEIKVAEVTKEKHDEIKYWKMRLNNAKKHEEFYVSSMNEMYSLISDPPAYWALNPLFPFNHKNEDQDARLLADRELLKTITGKIQTVHRVMDLLAIMPF